MKRTLIQFDEQTYQKLRQRAFRQERSMSSLVRDLVARGLETDTAQPRPTRVDQFSSVRSGRSKQDPLAPVSERHDEALARSFKA